MKRGFTLIELLAVIVIIAIISLIAFPVINKIVNNSRIAANARSVEGHISDIEYAIIKSSMKDGLEASYDGTYEVFGDFNFPSFPEKDNIRCSNYVIVKGNVESAEGCKADAWKKAYCYNRGENASVCVPRYTVNVTNGVKSSVKTVKEGSKLTTVLSSDEYEILDVEVLVGGTKLNSGYSYDEDTKTLVINSVNNTVQVNCSVAKKLTGFAKTIYDNNTIQKNNPTLTTTTLNSNDPVGLYRLRTTNGYGNGSGYTYYFRGNVTNNYVSFAGLTWRIVRINEDGTVRLMLLSEVANPSYSDSSPYYTESFVKPKVDSWFETKITNAGYGDKVATGNYFCQQAKAWADRVNNSPYEGQVYYDEYTPDMNCSNDVNGKGLVNTNVALISYDEMIYAGAYPYTHGDCYLCIGNAWTMSPAGKYGRTTMWFLNDSPNDKKSLRIYDVYLGAHAFSSMPVINLKADVTAHTESNTNIGSSTNPYIID